MNNRVTIGFRPGSLMPKIEERAGDDITPTAVSKRDLERLYTTLPLELRDVHLSADEAELLLRLYQAAWPDGMEAVVIPLLPATVAQELEHRPGLNAGRVAAGGLMADLQKLCAGQRLAVVDAIERALRLVTSGNYSHGDALRQVGLID